MKNDLQKLLDFSNSTFNSSEEAKFMDSTVDKYYNEKLRKEYSETLARDHNVVRMAGNNTSSKKSNITRILMIIGAIIAILSATLFLTRVNQQPTVNYQVAGNMDPYYTDIDFSTRGAITDASKLVEIGEFYGSKDYHQVSAIYSTLESLEIEGNYLHAMGVSLANNNQLDEAIKVWNTLLSTEESKFTYHNVARWFMGRAMIESGKYLAEGKKVLSELTADSQYYNDAQKLLSEN